jgi:hypothetical protein
MRPVTSAVRLGAVMEGGFLVGKILPRNLHKEDC